MTRKAISTVLCLLGWTLAAECNDLQLAENGKAEYEIVQPENQTDVDAYAVKTLVEFLRDKTGGVIFPVAPEANTSQEKKHIFIGLSPAVLKQVGAAPLDSLKDQEHVAKNIGNDIFLYGKGIHGNYYAVIDFIEKNLGFEWYNESEFITFPKWGRKNGNPIFSADKNLKVKAFARKSGFSFPVREGTVSWPFWYYHGINQGSIYPSTVLGMKSLYFMPTNCHTLFAYIPPEPGRQVWPEIFGWLPKKDYFKSNPEFFSLNKNGKRLASMQLCFSNPELRKELTKNVHEHIKLLKSQGREHIVLNISADDNAGSFCYCPECKKLEEKHNSPGGPLYDYLFEVCADLKQTEPHVRLHTLAYRTAQTQTPPTMLQGMTFPENLIVTVATVEADGDKTFDTPANRSSYEDLRAWVKLTPHVWVWYYVYPPCAPCANIERIVIDLHLMKKAGVEGVFYEFPRAHGYDFTELQKYLYAKLTKNINADVPALIKDFTDNVYGAAAPTVREYIIELDNEQKIASADTSLKARKGYARHLTFPLGALYRWQESFDKMENIAAKDPTALKNIRRLRVMLDTASLDRWNELKKQWPDYFSDYRKLIDRIGELPVLSNLSELLKNYEVTIKAGGLEKPLPEQFTGIDKSLISRFIPPRGRGVPEKMMDADAAFGYATVINLPDKPFQFGFYQNDTAKHGARRSLSDSDISMGSYRIYELGEIAVTQNCIVWFSAKSWLTNLQIGDRLYSPPSPDNDNRYDVYVSLKFDKPMPLSEEQIKYRDQYSSTFWKSCWEENAPYTALCDQVIFVRKPVKKQ